MSAEKTFSCLVGAAIGAMTLCASPVRAADKAVADIHGLETIIVTAEKVANNLQKTPISAIAFTQKDLESRQITNTQNLNGVVPSLFMHPGGADASSAIIFMRGIGIDDTRLTHDPSVSIYLDGFVMERQNGLSTNLGDLERVEVLRGPQGTLYGRNSSGGAINFITAKPTGVFGYKERVGFGNYGQFNTNTQVNLPEFDHFSVKLSLDYNHNSGWVKNLPAANGASNGPNFNYKRSIAGRIAVRWRPTDDFTADYFYENAHSDFGPQYWQTVGPYSTAADGLDYASILLPSYTSPGPTNVPGGLTTRMTRVQLHDYLPMSTSDAQTHGLTLEWRPNDSLTLKSLTGYRDLDVSVFQQFGGNPVATLYVVGPKVYLQKQFTQELQAIGSLGSDIKYVGGLYYYWEHGSEIDDQAIGLPFGPGGSIISLTVGDRRNRATNSSYAAYAQATWSPSAILDGRFHLTGGARYTHDDRNSYVDILPGGFQPPLTNAGAKASSHSITPVVTLAYDVTDDVNVYAKYSQGYRAGGFNPAANSLEGITHVVKPEKVKSWEGGLRSEWLDKRLRVNATAYYEKFTDMIIQFDNSLNDLEEYNAGKATLNGIELELAVRPVDALLMNVNYTFASVKFNSVIDPFAHIDVTNQFHQANVPHNSVNADVTYTFPQTPIGVPSARVEYMYRGYTNLVPKHFPGMQSAPYSLWNASVTLADIPAFKSDNVEVQLWMNNITSKKYMLNGIPGFPWVKPGAEDVSVVFGDPRTFGINITYRH